MNFEIIISNHSFMQQCGVATVTKQSIPSWLIEDQDEARVAAMPADTAILVILKEVSEQLTSEELAAIIAHEEGHHACDHMDKHAGYQTALEIEADAYAISKVGAKALYSAVRKCLLVATATEAKTDKMSNTEVFGNLRYAAKKLKPRFVAMRAAM